MVIPAKISKITMVTTNAIKVIPFSFPFFLCFFHFPFPPISTIAHYAFLLILLKVTLNCHEHWTEATGAVGTAIKVVEKE